MAQETDFRVLCAELVACAPNARRMDGISTWEALLTRARAALAEPEPEGPTDEAVEGAAQYIYAAMRFQREEETPEWELRGNSHAQDFARKTARAVLARWGRPTPQPESGEVQEVVKWLRSRAGIPASPDFPAVADYLTRAADLLSQRHPQPVPVSERLPEPGVKVLAHYLNGLGKGRTICAIWVPAKSRADDYDLDNDDFLEYNEEDDKFYWPEGWYEAIENWDDLGWVKVWEGEIVYWQTLPQWPACALPLPGEVEG